MESPITEFEQEAGLIAYDGRNLPQVNTLDEFVEHARANKDNFHNVDYASRLKFLEANGYDLTRKNFTDFTLSVPAEQTE